ncbi:ArsR/SmtB family transcription factor [Actinomycetes bacterium M1A6_2h]
MARGEQANTEALRVLREAGVVVKGGDLETVELVHPGHQGSRRLRWKTTTAAGLMNQRRELEASEATRSTLFIVPIAPQTDIVLTEAFDLRLNVVVLDPPQVVMDGDSITTSLGRHTPDNMPRRRGRLAVGLWAIERVLLLAGEPRTQGELAGDSGISQQAVSHALRWPRNQGLVGSTPQGFVALNNRRAELLKDWLAHYPGPRGMETYWFGLDSTLDQSRKVAAFAAEMEVDALLSGDAAIDVYAPWRTPVASIIYLSELLDLTGADLVPATRADATLTAIVPRDHTLWATARSSGTPGLVDPMIALRDLQRVGGLDADQAAERLSSAILQRDVR